MGLFRPAILRGFLLFVLLLEAFSGPVCAQGSAVAQDSPPEVELELEIIATAPTRFPRALARATDGALWAAFQSETGVMEGAGLARVLPQPGIVLQGSKTPGWRSDKVHALLPASGGGILAATEHGLHRVSSEGIATPLGEDLPWHVLASRPDGEVWMCGIDERHRLCIGRLVSGKIKSWKAHGGFREILGIFPRPFPKTGVWVVTPGEILEADGRILKTLPLGTTLLHLPPAKDVERKMPPVWLYDCAQTPDGNLFLIGAHKKIVRFGGGRFDVVGDGHFSEVQAGLREQELFATGFDGKLWKWDGKTLSCIDEAAKRRNLGHLTIDDRGSAWVEEDIPNEPHSILRFDPPFGGGPRGRASLALFPGLLSPGVLFILGDGTGGVFLSTNEGLCRVKGGPETPETPFRKGATEGDSKMASLIIRVVPMVHCARGPQLCRKCRDLGGTQICLLDIAPPNSGMVTRRTIEVCIDGEKSWREFEIVRSFANEAEARAYAAKHGIKDVEMEFRAKE